MTRLEGVDRAFRCPECGNTLSVPNSNPIAFYCADYDCTYERKWNELSTEQRYYGLVFQSMDETRAKTAVVKHLSENNRGKVPDESKNTR